MKMLYRFYLVLFSLVLSAISQADTTDSISSKRYDWLIEQGILQANKAPKNINSLIYENSPYLLSHAFQPVNWFAWHEDILAKAKDEQRLIYLSIGYETCHWCHVLAEESYADKAIALILNQNFISIKVDRERRPDIDQKYRRALENMTGSPGWPIQVILTPDNKIVWIESYTPKDKLQKTLSVLSKKWKKSPAYISRLALLQQKQLLPELKPSSVSISNLQHRTQYTELLASMRQVLKEEQEGNGPRFLRANWLLALLDEYAQSNKKGDLNIVIRHVEQLLSSPTYDFIDGGMHRYAEDGHWQRPHYEKMLYDQAQLIRVLIRLNLLTGQVNYLSFAQQTIEFVEKRLKLKNGLYASSLSALSAKVEGRYYHFHKPNFPQSPYWKANEINGLIALSLNSADLPPKALLNTLIKVRNQNTSPNRDDKAILAWNAMYLLSLAEFYHVDKQMVTLSKIKSFTQVISSYWHKGDLYRIVFKDQLSVVAQPEDYAWLSLALSEVHWTLPKFMYKKNLKRVQSALLSHVDEVEWSNLHQDSELVSSASIVLKALNQISNYSNEVETRSVHTVRSNMMSKFSPLSLQLNSSNLIFNWFDYVIRPSNLIKPFARGHGVIRVKKTSNLESIIEIELEKGWHINSNSPLQKSLIRTEIVDNGQLIHIIYPEPKIKSLAFNKGMLSLYEGVVNLTLRFGNIVVPKKIMLRVQACSDRICLPPENIPVAIY